MTSKFTNLPWPAPGRPGGEAPPGTGSDAGPDRPDTGTAEEDKTAG
ncbi:hypothetical protein ACWC6I_24955 [Streptomyces sp. NPDC001414]